MRPQLNYVLLFLISGREPQSRLLSPQSVIAVLLIPARTSVLVPRETAHWLHHRQRVHQNGGLRESLPQSASDVRRQHGGGTGTGVNPTFTRERVKGQDPWHLNTQEVHPEQQSNKS